MKFYAMKKTDTYLTPPSIFGGLSIFGGYPPFDLDPSCPPKMPWITATKMLSIDNGQDGLAENWAGMVWCNPPYSNWAEFAKKMAEHDNGFLLILNRTETRGFQDFVFPYAQSLFFFRKRVKFYDELGHPTKHAATAGSVIAAYGDEASKRLMDVDGFFRSNHEGFAIEL